MRMRASRNASCRTRELSGPRGPGPSVLKEVMALARRFGVWTLVVGAAFVLGCAAASPARETGTSSTTASAPSIVRGIYASWPYASEYPTIAGLGFNAVSVEPWRDRLDDLQSLGLKGLIWLGGYDNSTCTFVRSDAWVTDRVLDIRDHPAVLAYEIDNEPHDSGCRTAPQQIKDRVSFVRTLVAPYNAILYITLS